MNGYNQYIREVQELKKDIDAIERLLQNCTLDADEYDWLEHKQRQFKKRIMDLAPELVKAESANRS